MNIDGASKALQNAYYCRSEIVLCLLGAPGIGKTQAVYQLRDWIRQNTSHKECKIVEIIASQILPSEVSGLTMPDSNTHSMQIYDHARLSSLEDGDILFFDELLQAPMQVLSACLTLIQERRMMSGKKLPDIMIVAASNPLGSASSIPESIRQRFMFIDVEFSPKPWKEYMERVYGEYLVDNMISEDDLAKCTNLILQSDKTCYNIITPRSITKCIEWIGKIPNHQTSSVLHVIDDMFGHELAQTISKMVDRYDPLNKAIYDAIMSTVGETSYDIKNAILYCNSFEDLVKNIEDISKVTGKDLKSVLDSIEYEYEEVECID